MLSILPHFGKQAGWDGDRERQKHSEIKSLSSSLTPSTLGEKKGSHLYWCHWQELQWKSSLRVGLGEKEWRTIKGNFQFHTNKALLSNLRCFFFSLHQGSSICWPRAEEKTHIMSRDGKEEQKHITSGV